MALNPTIAKLEELTTAVAKTASSTNAIAKGKRGSGRYGRKPNFAVLAAPSTRPNSGAGVTFHFKHTFVSKKNSVSGGYRDLTSAAAHQRYIERSGAAEKVFTEENGNHEISFGNLGATKEERSDFWRKVEQIEGKAGRVQYRMIIELPHELSPTGREQAAQAFMDILGKRGFPHWAVIHAPDKHNDHRNYHLHAVYYDRPCERLPDGRWDFEVETEIKWKNGQRQLKRPLKQNKDKEVRGEDWIRQLRASWAEIANEHLKAENLSKRYDPRPYRESGIRKMPTAHLGNKIALAESQGIDTKIGAENSRREMRYRLSKPDDNFERISDSLDKAISSIQFASRDRRTGGNPDRAMMAGLAFRRILSAGVKAAKAREANALAADVIGARLAKRAGFLDAEYDRLTIDPPAWLGQDQALNLAASLWDERRLIDDATADIAPFRAACRKSAADHETEAARLDHARRSAAAAMIQAYPALRQLMRPAELADLELPLANTDFQATPVHEKLIDRPVPAQPPMVAVDEKAGIDPASQTTAEKDIQPGNHAEQTTPAAEKTPEEALPFSVQERPAQQKPEAKKKAKLAKEAPVFGLELENTKPVQETATKEAKRKPTTLDLPGALLIDDKTNVEELTRQLAAAPGWQVRYHYLATRDASYYSDNEAIAAAHVKALERVEKEAANRGLDLETGRMDPARAKIKSAFEAHKNDWQPLPGDAEFEQISAL